MKDAVVVSKNIFTAKSIPYLNSIKDKRFNDKKDSSTKTKVRFRVEIDQISISNNKIFVRYSKIIST